MGASPVAACWASPPACAKSRTSITCGPFRRAASQKGPARGSTAPFWDAAPTRDVELADRLIRHHLLRTAKLGLALE